MKTDDLIQVLASDRQAVPTVRQRLIAALPATLLVVGVGLMAALGVRPDLMAALTTPVTMLKNLLPLALGLSALALAVRVSRPEGRGAVWLLAVFPLVAAVLFAGTMMQMPAADWKAGMMGHTAAFCVPVICLTSALPLAALLYALRSGASMAPMRSGMLAGLAAGGLGTAIYAMHCTEDNPLFFVTWYGLAIVIMTGLGALIGRRLLRW